MSEKDGIKKIKEDVEDILKRVKRIEKHLGILPKKPNKQTDLGTGTTAEHKIN